MFLIVSCQKNPSDSPDDPNKQAQIPWSSLADSPWPVYHHDYQGTGRSQFRGSQTGVVFLEFNDSFWLESSPVIGPDSTLYLVSSEDSSYLYAIKPDGSIRWKSFLTFSSGYYSNNGTPTLAAGGVIYVCSSKPLDEKIHAIRTDNGSELWSYSESVNTSITLDHDGYLYFLTNQEPRRLVSLTPQAGLRWDVEIPSGIWDSWTPIIFSTDGQQMYVYGVFGADSVYAISTSGSKLWSYYTGGWPGYIMVDNSDHIYLTRRSDWQVVSLDYEGKEVWSFSIADFGYSMIDMAKAGTIGPFGNLYLCGESAEGNSIFSLSPYGNFRWSITDLSRTDLVSDKNGNIYWITNNEAVCVSSEGDLVYREPLPENVSHVDYSPTIGYDSDLYLGHESPDLQLVGIR